jgi:DNA uptake protein ComE-like DNA-binding protein
MEKSFRQLLREYFYFSKKDRRGVLLLGTIIVLVIAGIFIADTIQLNQEYDFSEFKAAIKKWDQEKTADVGLNSLFSFNPNNITEEALDSLLLPRFVKSNILSYRKAGGKFYRSEDVRKIYGMNDSIFEAIEKYIVLAETEKAKGGNSEINTVVAEPEPVGFTGTFDPNVSDSAELSAFGFNAFQTSNLLKYRENGGSFSAPADLLKIYGIDSAFYSIIKNSIVINPQPVQMYDEPEDRTAKTKIQVELNSADSTDLIQLSGIGSVFAGRIIKYRQLLGGFYSVEQLLEVYNLPEETFREIHPNISVDPNKIQPIRLNFAVYGELLRHPYIEKEEVEAILDYRNKQGPFRNFNELKESGIIDAEKVEELKPYLTCR